MRSARVAGVLLVVLLGAVPPYPAAGVGTPAGTLEDLLARRAWVSACARAGEDLARALSSGDRRAELRAFQLRARAEDGLGRAGDGAADRERAQRLARELGDRNAEAALLRDAAARHVQRAEYTDAEHTLADALAMARSSGDRSGEAAALELRARSGLKTGRYAEALADAEHALLLQDADGARAPAAATLITIGLIHLDRRNIRDAVGAFEQSLRLAQGLGDLAAEVEANCHVAIAHLFEDAPDEAIAVLIQTAETVRRAGDEALEARVAHILGNAYRRRGDDHDALENYARAAAFYGAEGDRREAAWILSRTSRAEAALGRFDEAEKHLREAIAVWDEIGERRPAAYARYDLGRLLARAGDPQAALTSWETALTQQRAIDLPYQALVLSDLALLHAERGERATARRLADDAVAAATTVDNPEMLWTALYRRARVERRDGRREDAVRSLRACVAIIERMRRDVTSLDEARSGLLEERQAAFRELADVLVDLGQPGEALVAAEQGRARALAELLDGRHVGPPPPAADPGRTASITSAPSVPEARGGATATPGSRKVAGAAREKGVRAAPGPASTGPGLRELLGTARRARATIVEYVTGDRRCTALVVAPTGRIDAAPLSSTADELARLVDAARRSLAAGDRLPAALDELSNRLVAPIEGLLPRDPEALVVIVPDGPLHLLPFACLRDKTGRWFVERHTLSYAVAIHALARAPARSGAPAVVVGVAMPPSRGDEPALAPLVESGTEARAVAALQTLRPARLLLDDAATERNVRIALRGAGLVHIASHAVVRDGHPLQSFVSLAPGSGAADDDGRLTAREIFDLDLGGGLVTLSGCNTALGRVTGEGVQGFVRAFLAAGASGVLGSLWPVADRAGAYQMARFYAHLHATKGDRARALRLAQLDTLAALRRGDLRPAPGRPADDAPLWWAPFVLVGAAR